ncbi:hypothetical protein BJI48_07625 [Helicobacter sp. 11S02596-1]|nr:hypothetical protein BJI48_07625 [Helicobacter sp. 11S02596-1]
METLCVVWIDWQIYRHWALLHWFYEPQLYKILKGMKRGFINGRAGQNPLHASLADRVKKRGTLWFASG